MWIHCQSCDFRYYLNCGCCFPRKLNRQRSRRGNLRLRRNSKSLRMTRSVERTLKARKIGKRERTKL
jgi:hypothetical protein